MNSESFAFCAVRSDPMKGHPFAPDRAAKRKLLCLISDKRSARNCLATGLRREGRLST